MFKSFAATFSGNLGMRIVDVGLAILGQLRALVGEAQRAAAVEREDVVFAGLHVPERDHLDQLRAVRGGEIGRLGRVLGEVVKLPVLGVEFAQHVLGQGHHAEERPALLERGSGHRANRAPAVVIDRAVCEHLEILRLVPALGLRVLKDMGKAHAFDRRLADAANLRRRFDPERLENARDHVDRMRELMTDFPLPLIPFGQWTRNGSAVPPR